MKTIISMLALAMFCSAGHAACSGLDFKERFDKYLAANPSMRAQMMSVANSGKLYVGMPESAVDLMTCDITERTNTSENASGVTRQIVLREGGGIFARYVYIKNGKVTSISN